MDEDDEEPVLFESEQIWFSKNPDGHYVIALLDGSIELSFAPLVVAEDGSTLFPLVAVKDDNGNLIHRELARNQISPIVKMVV